MNNSAVYRKPMKRASNAPRIFSPSGLRQTSDTTVAQRKKNKLNAPSAHELAELERDMQTPIEQAPLAGLQDATFDMDANATGTDITGDANADADTLANDPDIIAAIKERDDALALKAHDLLQNKTRMLAAIRAETASAKRSYVPSIQSARTDTTGILNMRPNPLSQSLGYSLNSGDPMANLAQDLHEREEFTPLRRITAINPATCTGLSHPNSGRVLPASKSFGTRLLSGHHGTSESNSLEAINDLFPRHSTRRKTSTWGAASAPYHSTKPSTLPPGGKPLPTRSSRQRRG